MAWFLNIDLTELIYCKTITFGEGGHPSLIIDEDHHKDIVCRRQQCI